ncbi:MAG: HlyD family efflux transporter periplasmic adaptor subunit [Nevskiaceae bacterium]|nr:MAG: HlyD family efflux transporter periplasmic adaptor subunit [Nevskiaceae bacterium]
MDWLGLLLLAICVGCIMSDLFRSEVLHQNQAQWLGSIRIARPPSFLIVTCVTLLMALALLIFVIGGEVTRKARLTGLLVPGAGLINVVAPQSGYVAEVLVHEGQEVRKGQPLMRIRTEKRLVQGNDAAVMNAQALAERRASLETERALLRQQAGQRQDAIAEQLRSLHDEERYAEAELETNRIRVQLAGKGYNRFVELRRDGYVSDLHLQQRHEELLDHQRRERSAERSLQVLRRGIQALRAENFSNKVELNTSLARLERSLVSLSQEHLEHEARIGLTITATQSGRISALPLQSGQAVQPGQTVLSMIGRGDDSATGEAIANAQSSPASLQAQLWAPSRTVGFVRPGQTVWLRFAAYPYQKFGMAEGVVQAISESPFAPQDVPQGYVPASKSNEVLYRVSVRLKSQYVQIYGQAVELKAGMALEADVMQDRRRIWEWILEPLLAVSVRQDLHR